MSRTKHRPVTSDTPSHHALAPAPLHQAKKKSIFAQPKTWVLTFAFLFVAGGVFLAGRYSVGGLASVREALGGSTVDALDLSSVQQTYRQLAAEYDGELDTKTLIEGANRGLVKAVGDDYTVYLDSKEADLLDQSLTGNIGGGVGIEIGMRNDRPTVIRLLKDNPAEAAGVRADDIITKVNDKPVGDQSISELVKQIRGEPGTTVKLTVSRGGEQKEISITRDTINNPSVYSKIKDGIGIMTITRFDENTASLARAAARDFTDAKVKGVILDLRGNGGGYVNAAQEVAGVWLKNKVVVVERRGDKVIDELKSGSSPVLENVPTVVLVNQSSASASEIVAGALRDHKAATLIGETTFGKGSVQQLIELSNDAILKVTIARWYTPSGATISEKGITPDTVVELTEDDFNAKRDPQLDAALKALR